MQRCRSRFPSKLRAFDGNHASGEMCSSRCVQGPSFGLPSERGKGNRASRTWLSNQRAHAWAFASSGSLPAPEGAAQRSIINGSSRSCSDLGAMRITIGCRLWKIHDGHASRPARSLWRSSHRAFHLYPQGENRAQESEAILQHLCDDGHIPMAVPSTVGVEVKLSTGAARS